MNVVQTASTSEISLDAIRLFRSALPPSLSQLSPYNLPSKMTVMSGELATAYGLRGTINGVFAYDEITMAISQAEPRTPVDSCKDRLRCRAKRGKKRTWCDG
ncbi:hypothetical protein M413DRAFT_160443 [Hebeloma cylindrosporum]|uniref:Uncharacterized protein n=1 Tax=Hebeloma cylindrosporum TaxID=76867 RepID=A0A0C2YJJ6_HEBCY|nr:hypothetical protein M413DRAFT_160443 [Hebeloma cylindrosporum h7]